MKKPLVLDFFRKNSIRSLVAVSTVLGAITVLNISCVSKKKYEAALQEIARLTVDSTFQEYNKVDIAYTKDSVIYDQKKELRDKSYAIDSLAEDSQ